MKTNDFSALEKKIGYTFKDKSLLREAMCHSSYVNERKSEHIKCSERLEFLGDSVLSEIVSEYLFLTYVDAPEGVLSSMRREIVDSEALAEFSRSVGIGEYLLLGKGEEALGGRERRTNLEDAFEALVAAIYLDGGKGAARDFVIPFAERTVERTVSENKFTDAKSKLQEIVQRGGGEAPKYVITSETGPDHDKRFECDVLVDNNVMGHGSGPSKKAAEKAAAEQALVYFGD
ncbi:MAG: ribonuclease III [Clostridia bacterium]|nr:ribonuclease III [Clostridia bacterium]